MRHLQCLMLTVLVVAPVMSLRERPARAVPAASDDQLYTTHDIAALLQVDPSTVSKWIDKGLLMAFRAPGGHRRVRAGDLRSFLIAHRMPVPDELGSGAIRLLAVDDERGVVEGYKRAFLPHAKSVDLQVTTSGVEALLLLSEQRPAAILVDWKMPDLDGLEICRRVRARKQMASTRLILVADACSPELVTQAKQAGAITCLPKPLDVPKVLDLLGVKAPATPAAPAPAPKPGAPPAPR